MSEQAEHYLRLLQRASSALDSACQLLDKRFQSRRWREDWTIYSGTEDELQEIAARLTGHTGATGRHDRRVAATILENV